MNARVSPIDRDGVLAAFVKLLAPRPLVYVFREVSGWQYAAIEMPGTHQVVLGVSAELLHYIEDSIYRDTGHHVTDRVEVCFAEGNSLTLVVPTRPSIVAHAYDDPALWEPPPTIELRLKPIAAAAPTTGETP